MEKNRSELHPRGWFIKIFPTFLFSQQSYPNSGELIPAVQDLPGIIKAMWVSKLNEDGQEGKTVGSEGL